MRLLPLVLLSLLAVPAAAAPPTKVVRDAAKPSSSERKARATLAAELRKGRTLASKGKHAEAIKAFEAALRAVPDEPRVLLELGWVLRVAGDLPRAEDACRRAAQPKVEPALRAPALYNLGRVLEQKGDKPGAITAYRSSLELRENRIVRERLLGLDSTASSDSTRPVPLEGPVASIAAWCAAQKDEPCHLGDEAAVHVRLAGPAGPWREAQIFTAGDDEQSCVLALRTERGWFFTALATCKNQEWRTDVKATLEAEDLLGSPGEELRITLEGIDSMKDFDEESGRSVCCVEAELSMLAVCGLGPSKVPSCTPAIELRPPLEAKPQGGDVGLDASFAGDELTLSRGDGKPAEHARPRLHPQLRALAGRHRVVFP